VLAAIPATGAQALHLDPDTVVSPGSGEAARRAAGAVVAAVDAVMGGRFDRAFCAIRPPGHHAEPARPMGFCLFNNVAVGALHARAVHKVNRIAVVDFDVHHGNGTQAIFENDPDLFYGSIHQAPFYPGTGRISERGVAGNIMNIPFGAGSGGIMVRRAFIERLIPALDEFMPDLLLVSAGFDAHHRDPVGGMDLGTEDFAWMTQGAGRCHGLSCSCADDGALILQSDPGLPCPAAQGRLTLRPQSIRPPQTDRGGSEAMAAADTLPPEIAELSFEDALKQLEQIVRKLESGEARLEEAIEDYERGALLRRHCERKLAEAKAKVERIVLGGDGRPAGLEPVDPE
jgi:exodeoxyribonuclease VII small subunit